MRDQMERLVSEMLDKGVHYDDARREFEKMFIARALQRTKGNVGIAADLLGLHRNTIARKIAEYRIKRSRLIPRCDAGAARRGNLQIDRDAPVSSVHWFTARSRESRPSISSHPLRLLDTFPPPIELAVGQADC